MAKGRTTTGTSLARSFELLVGRRLVKPEWRFLTLRLTAAGQALLLVWFGSAVLGNASMGIPLYWLFGFTTAALGMAGLLARFAVPRPLGLRRRGVSNSSAGETLAVEVEVENRGRRAARDLELMETDLPRGLRSPGGGAARLASWSGSPPIARLGPGEKAVCRVWLRCERRGAYALRGLRAASAFPLGLWRGLVRADEELRFLVYPSFPRIESFPVPEGRNYQPGGFLLSSNVGESSEFMHTREYREGDNPRHVHWASTARLGRPVVKVYHEEYFVRLALVVDTEVARGAGDECFEWGVSLAAGIADYLSRREYIIDIFAAGARVYHFRAGRALAHFDNILQILACLDSTPAVSWTALSEAILPEAPKLTGVVAILQDWSPERERFVRQLQAEGVATRVLLVRPEERPPSLAPPPVGPEELVQVPPGTSPP